jgi:hypothetical protein
MSTSIYKVSDGSIITFKKRGPELSAILTTPGGQVFNGPSRMSSTEESAAREILLANNIVDPNSGEPLPYIIEGGQDQSTTSKATNYVYEISRVTMSEVTDETTLSVAKTNKEILNQDNKALDQTLKSDLPPDVKFANFINGQKATIKKRLIPFVIGLITPFAPQVIPLIVSNLGISGDTTADSLQAAAKEKTDKAKATADEAKNTTKDRDAIKTLATGAVAGAATVFILGKITKDQLIGLIDCPTAAKISSIIKQRNSLVNQINGMYKTTTTLTVILGITTVVISIIQTGITLAKANPYPSTGIPPLGLPPLTAGAQTSIASFVAELENQIKVKNKTLTTITLSVGSFAIFLGIILKFLKMLDIILEHCAENQNMNLEKINDEINALANPTVVATQNNSNNQDVNTYKGFTLAVKIDSTNTSKYIRRYAVAQNKQGVPVLKTDSSFASDPSVLISQLKFIIDSTPNITAE